VDKLSFAAAYSPPSLLLRRSARNHPLPAAGPGRTLANGCAADAGDGPDPGERRRSGEALP